MKPISQLLADMNALDADVPSFEAPASEAISAEPTETETEGDQREVDVDDVSDGEPVVDQPDPIDDPTQPSVTVDEFTEAEEPSVAVTEEPEPSVSEMDVPEEPSPEVPESDVEPVAEPSVPEQAVESLSEPDVTQPFVDEIESPAVAEVNVDESDEPAADIESPSEMDEPSVPETGVEAIPDMPNTSTPVGDQGTIELPPITIDEYNSGEFDDVPDQADIDKQISRQVEHERQRGEDLATRMHEELKPLFDGIHNQTVAAVHDVVEIEAMTLAMMRED